VATTRLRDVATLDAFLNDLPLLFRGSIYAWFSALLPPVGGPEAYRMRQSDLSGERYTTDPAPSVTHRREDNNRVRFLTTDEEKKLRKILEAKWASHMPELDLAINAGIRKGSQYGLTWDMVDWKGRC